MCLKPLQISDGLQGFTVNTNPTSGNKHHDLFSLCLATHLAGRRNLRGLRDGTCKSPKITGDHRCFSRKTTQVGNSNDIQRPKRHLVDWGLQTFATEEQIVTLACLNTPRLRVIDWLFLFARYRSSIFHCDHDLESQRQDNPAALNGCIDSALTYPATFHFKIRYLSASTTENSNPYHSCSWEASFKV